MCVGPKRCFAHFSSSANGLTIGTKAFRGRVHSTGVQWLSGVKHVFCARHSMRRHMHIFSFNDKTIKPRDGRVCLGLHN